MRKPVPTLNELIRLEAYLLSEAAGHPKGMDAVFWTQAEAIVYTRAAASLAAAREPSRAKAVAKKAMQALAKVARKPAQKTPPATAKSKSANPVTAPAEKGKPTRKTKPSASTADLASAAIEPETRAAVESASESAAEVPKKKKR